jgi:hypothetical protein
MILRNGKFSGKILWKIFWKIFHLTSLVAGNREADNAVGCCRLSLLRA